MALVIEPETPPLAVDDFGVVRVGGTRLTLDTVLSDFRAGVSAEDIADSYRGLALADVYAVITYYLRHRDEVDAYLRERERIAAEVQAETERRFPPEGIKARLLARMQAKS